MSRIDGYLQSPNLSELSPSYPIWLAMARLGVSITLIRGSSTTVDAQTVIAAPLDGRREIKGDAGTSQALTLALIGYRGVSGKDDFDVKAGDRFAYNDSTYRVAEVDKTIPGRTEAYCVGLA